MRNLLLLFFFFLSSFCFSQQIKKALFIGNSYTGVNMLPVLVDSITLSLGDSLIYDMNTPGGYTYQMHCADATTNAKINSNSWDYVILQEQSQLPSFSPSQVQIDVIPYADTLNQKIKANDSCTTTLFYMTWGRKNGDASNCQSYPPVCTYAGMQSRLRSSYLLLAQMFGEVCPAGMAWKRVRDLDSTINLYQSDESHPTIIGSYLVACTFYACIFHKSPVGASYIPAGVPVTTAQFLQAVADSIVFDSLAVWNIDTFPPHPAFAYSNLGSGTFQFNNSSSHASSYFWDFGDGSTSYLMNPSHTYATPGSYYVTLVTNRNCLTDSAVKHLSFTTGIKTSEFKENNVSVYPVPSKEILNVNIIGVEKAITAEIIDINGSVIRKPELRNRSISDLKSMNRTGQLNLSLDISGLPEGVYCLRISDGKNNYKPVRFVKL